METDLNLEPSSKVTVCLVDGTSVDFENAFVIHESGFVMVSTGDVVVHYNSNVVNGIIFGSEG